MSSLSQEIQILSCLFRCVQKRLDKKDKINLKIYDIQNNVHIDNEIWQVNRIWHEKQFSWKIIDKTWWRNYSQTFFYKIRIEHTSGSIAQSVIYTVRFYCMWSWGLSKYIKTELQTNCFTSNKAFSKNKKEVWS